MGKYALGLCFAFLIGYASRKLGVPTCAPLTFYGDALVFAMTLGFALG